VVANEGRNVSSMQVRFLRLCTEKVKLKAPIGSSGSNYRALSLDKSLWSTLLKVDPL